MKTVRKLRVYLTSFFTNSFSSCKKHYAQNTCFRYRIIVVFGNMNVKFENDRKHCALQIN